MKKIFAILTTLLVLASCAEFTELQPKGKNLLSTTDELELLLNSFEYGVGNRDMQRMTGDMISYTNIPNLLVNPTPSRYSIMITWDESKMDKMAELTSNDSDYSELYGYIGKISNPILSRVEEAAGDEAKKNQLKAEAYALRAYAEYILVNKFAAAYNPSTAANTSGIPILLEDWDISEPTEQWTIAEVYDQIIADCDAAINLNALPANAINRMRINKTCPLIIKALALMSMQKFDEAESIAKTALGINGNIDNYLDAAHTTMTQGYMMGGLYPSLFLPKLQMEEDMLSTYDMVFYEAITPEAQARAEEGYATITRIASMDMAYDYLMPACPMVTGVDGILSYDLNSSWNTYGLKTTQLYLIVAECEIRKGNIDEAMRVLDLIRVNRIEPDLYVPLQGNVTTKADANMHLKQVYQGEQYYTPYLFFTRKRWNQLDDMKETFTRNLLGTTYTLKPESKLWIFPFPQNAINNNPNLKQNYL